MFQHQDTLDALNKSASLSDKVASLQAILQRRFPFVQHSSVAVFDPKTELLKTFADSGGGNHRLRQYEAPLTDAPSLQAILDKGRPRVVNDLDIFAHGAHQHTQRIRAQGYGSSYTLPMYVSGTFFGFIFFNSREKEVFTDEVLHYLDLFGHLIALMVINEVSGIRTLQASIKTATSFLHQRDEDTGSHLDRMSNFARLIARDLAQHYQLTDELIEHIFLFAPLHDIGKIAIPDHVLRKPGKLDEAEFTIMKSHAEKGREIIDVMLSNFGLEGLQHIDMLRNIAMYHHEAINGGGYPAGLKGNDIPVEARIVAVADIFDALTSRRPYKEAWSNDQAFDMLRRMAGTKVDQDCVEALIRCRTSIEDIQAKFQEDPYG